MGIPHLLNIYISEERGARRAQEYGKLGAIINTGLKNGGGWRFSKGVDYLEKKREFEIG